MHRAGRALLLAAPLWLLGCGPRVPLRPDGAALGPTGATCPDGGSTFTYESFGRAFFATYCQTCHASTVIGTARFGAPSSETFDDVLSIRAEATMIDELAAAGPDRVNTDMPRSFPVPNDAERHALGEWLACGAP